MFSLPERKTVVSLVSTLLLIPLFLTIRGAIAQAPPPDDGRGIAEEASLAATVRRRINYQGVLEEDGSPVDDTRDMTFDFYTNDTCSGSPVHHLVEGGVPISDGFFDVDVDIPHDVFHGEGIWLKVTVGGTVFGCEEILPVPYALSLRPGATIVGETAGSAFGDGALNVENAASPHMAIAAGIFARTATGSAVRTESDSAGVYAESTWQPAFIGKSTNATAADLHSDSGYGIRVETDGDDHWDHAGYFTAEWGNGVLASSTHNVGIRSEAGDIAGLWQPAGKVGAAGIGEARGLYGSGGTGAGVTGVSREDSGVVGETENDDSEAAAGVEGQDWSGSGTAVRGNKYGTSGVAVYGTNRGDTGSGVWGASTNYYGMFAESEASSGIYAKTARGDHNYGLYTPDNVYSRNYHMTGALMQVVQNGGETTLEPGDVAAFDGVTTSTDAGGLPIIQVTHAAQANDPGVAGVVHARLDEAVLTEGARATGSGEGMRPQEMASDGPIRSGQYLLLVVHGPARVKVEALSDDLQPGDLLAAGQARGLAGRALTVSLAGVDTAVPGIVLGKALEPLNAGEEGDVLVFVTLD